uniref:SYTL2_0 protein n=1 Tax=Fopius arisanus TaxID=64838 RepID=A0A0C9RZK1_9HYME
MGKTRGVHETTPELRNRMVGMYEAGLGLREIAAAINCSQRTVKRWLNRFDKEGTVETRERCGRKRATTSEQDDAIVRLATQTPITAAKAVLPALGLNCSVDTIRERLHKAGIHNWSPSRKHIQRIPLGEAEGAALQQAVWRPTGTQLGKKKSLKIPSRAKTSPPKVKRKKSVKKSPPKETTTCETPEKQLEVVPQIPFNPPTVLHCNDLPPLPHQQLMDSQNQFHPQAVPNQQMYHPEMNISQNWPLDLVQSTQNPSEYLQNPGNLPPPTSSHLQELYPQNNQIHHQLEPQMSLDQHSKPVNISEGSSSSNSSTEPQTVDVALEDTVMAPPAGPGEISAEDQAEMNAEKRKKGGKAKGTLETSVELRNRMIGMSQAGLSTLSIALAINRSERTVKRWLERWKKEGNVQTKERKGRRRITTKEQDDAIIAMATQNPLTAAKHVAPALGLNCSVDTIRERLHKAGIHSWKLGKKQGEGNAVHTVHLWQPSGNRPNRPRILRKSTSKKSVGKKEVSRRAPAKRKMRKDEGKSVDVRSEEGTRAVESIQAPPEVPGIEQEPMQFHDEGISPYNPNSNVLQPVSVLTPLTPSTSQQIHVTPVMRPDCRMATQVPAGYSSCMVGNGGHMEQPDPLNYEPYMWNF